MSFSYKHTNKEKSEEWQNKAIQKYNAMVIIFQCLRIFLLKCDKGDIALIRSYIFPNNCSYES